MYKVSVFGVFPVRIFLHSERMRRFTETRKSPNTDTFQAVKLLFSSSEKEKIFSQLFISKDVPIQVLTSNSLNNLKRNLNGAVLKIC